jgi:hypothetical protein
VNVLGIDPGLNACGIAWCRGEVWNTLTVRPRATELHHILREIVAQVPAGPWDLVVQERPQIYTNRKAKGDPNDMIPLAMLVGAIVLAVQPAPVLLPWPRQWKGTVPKDIHHARLRTRLPGIKACSKDAMDAVGLVLWAMDRAEALTSDKS